MSKSIRLVVLSVLSLSLLSVNPAAAQYKRRDLVSNVSGRALRTDSNLINGWGLAFFQHSPHFWTRAMKSGPAVGSAKTDISLDNGQARLALACRVTSGWLTLAPDCQAFTGRRAPPFHWW